MSPQVCTEEEKKKRKTKVRVDRDTLCMDTRSIAGVYQRFYTPLLHQQLHTHYFRTLSMIIINRSEIVATERRKMLLFEITRRNEAATAVRERDLQKTWRKMSGEGQQAALALDLSDETKAWVGKALA